MVTAGIYMVARLSVLYALSPTASTTVAVVGGLTALLAATIALRQRDIKKVLAYSTVSQLGYMFLGLGIGAYTAAVFHVVTHAFFKALLFLGAGSVIHALHHEQDAMKMGGLKKLLPTTHRTFLVGCLALAGVPPLAGFFSKDKILGEALTSGHRLFFVLGVLGLVTALMTAFYTFRLYTLVFTSPERLDHHTKEHAHESPLSITGPLQILMLLAIVGGGLSLPLGLPDSLGHYLESIFAPAMKVLGERHEAPHSTEIALLLLGTVVAVGGAFWGSRKYLDGPGEEAKPATAGLPYALENKWFVDEIYAMVVVGPMRVLALLSGFFDRYVIDGLVNGLARLADNLGRVVRGAQNGTVHAYALLFVAGAAFLALVLL
jgi:NADH-quinone oxidoreductase subunit L